MKLPAKLTLGNKSTKKPGLVLGGPPQKSAVKAEDEKTSDGPPSPKYSSAEVKLMVIAIEVSTPPLLS